jgi:hypothetical protein
MEYQASVIKQLFSRNRRKYYALDRVEVRGQTKW